MTVTPTIALPELSRSTPNQEASGGAANVQLHKQSSMADASAFVRKRERFDRLRRSDSRFLPVKHPDSKKVKSANIVSEEDKLPEFFCM
jgi:hypothetical protein